MDRWEGTVLMGTLLTPRFAPTALSSEGYPVTEQEGQVEHVLND